MSSLSRILRRAAPLAALLAAGAAQAYTNPPFSATGIGNPGYPDFVAGVLYSSVTNENCALSWNATDNAWVLSISASAPNQGAFNFASGAYLVGSEEISLTAYITSTGTLSTKYTSTYKITGSLAASSSPSYGTAPSGYSWSAVSNQTLFSANLTSIGVDTTHDALGFNTDDFGGWANQKQFTGSNTSESLWLYALINTGNLYCVAPRTNNNCNNSPSQTGTFPYSTTNTAWNTFLSELKSGSGIKAATFYGIGTMATVPLPAGFWLFGSGFAALGALRRRRAQASATDAQTAAAAQTS